MKLESIFIIDEEGNLGIKVKKYNVNYDLSDNFKKDFRNFITKKYSNNPKLYAKGILTDFKEELYIFCKVSKCLLVRVWVILDIKTNLILRKW